MVKIHPLNIIAHNIVVYSNVANTLHEDLLHLDFNLGLIIEEIK
jgi:hypothetical protein